MDYDTNFATIKKERPLSYPWGFYLGVESINVFLRITLSLNLVIYHAIYVNERSVIYKPMDYDANFATRKEPKPLSYPWGFYLGVERINVFLRITFMRTFPQPPFACL